MSPEADLRIAEARCQRKNDTEEHPFHREIPADPRCHGKNDEHAQQAADGTGGAGGQRRCCARQEIHKQRQHIPAEPGNEINKQKTDAPEIAFHIAAQHKEGNHVAAQMVNAEMQKHGRQQTVIFPVAQHKGGIQCAEAHCHLRLLRAPGQGLQGIDQNIDPDQDVGHDRIILPLIHKAS